MKSRIRRLDQANRLTGQHQRPCQVMKNSRSQSSGRRYSRLDGRYCKGARPLSRRRLYRCNRTRINAITACCRLSIGNSHIGIAGPRLSLPAK